jgi:hypothetical protein
LSFQNVERESESMCETMGGLEYFDFGFVVKEMGKSMPRGTRHGGGSRGRIVINYLRLDGVTVSIHGWVALSFFLQVSNNLFACAEICFDGMKF